MGSHLKRFLRRNLDRKSWLTEEWNEPAYTKPTDLSVTTVTEDFFGAMGGKKLFEAG